MPYNLIDKQVVYSGKKVRLELHHLEDEVMQKRIVKEVCVHPGAVVILPFLNDKTILLINNRRYAINQLLIELPAGTLEKGEVPMNAAGRELLEETGYLAGRLKPLLNLFPSPGILSEKMLIFAAYDLQRSQTALEEGEEIQVLPTCFDDAIGMIRTGEIQDAKTVATLLFYKQFHVDRV